jgi:hypothetical protein
MSGGRRLVHDEPRHQVVSVCRGSILQALALPSDHGQRALLTLNRLHGGRSQASMPMLAPMRSQ